MIEETILSTLIQYK